MYVDASLDMLVRLAGYYALGYGSYACLLVPLLNCRFRDAVVGVDTSRITCCRGSFTSPASTSLRRHFSLLLRHRQLWSTCQFQDSSRALADAMRSWREGSSRPREEARLSAGPQVAFACGHTYLCGASRCHARDGHASCNPGRISLPRQWLGRQSRWISRPRVLIGPLGKTPSSPLPSRVLRRCSHRCPSCTADSAELPGWSPPLVHSIQGLFAQWLRVAPFTNGQFAIVGACMVTVGASRILFHDITNTGVLACSCVTLDFRPSVFWSRPDVVEEVSVRRRQISLQ